MDVVKSPSQAVIDLPKHWPCMEVTSSLCVSAPATGANTCIGWVALYLVVALMAAPQWAHTVDDITLDDTDATIQGAWSQSSFEGNYYGAGYLYTNVGDGSGTVSWQPAFGQTGGWQVWNRLRNGSATRIGNAR